MTTNIFAFSRKGCTLAKKIGEQFSDASCYALKKFSDKSGIIEIESTQEKLKELFSGSDLIVFVGAVGIAVRLIAPFVKSKTTDPAVIAVDECGQFVIPILSGHIGGANEYARILAKKLGATAVITTATDINGRFSVDEWAAKNGFYISDMEKAKRVSATILTDDVQVQSDFEIKGALPVGVTTGDKTVGFNITYKDINDGKLRLTPKVLYVGIGCKKDIPSSIVHKLFHKIFKEYQLDTNAVKEIVSIDLKKNEGAITALSQEYGIPTKFYTSEQLNKVQGDFSGSEFVKSVTGVDNVCERSAVLASGNGRLIVEKTALDGVTIAVALRKLEVIF